MPCAGVGHGASADPVERILIQEQPAGTLHSQRDNATSQGDRMYVFSTCAMAAAFLNPD
jgi:hypothetical protein